MNQTLCLEKKYLDEYRNNPSLYEGLESHVKQNLIANIDSYFPEYKKGNNFRYIFKSIRLIYLVCWLSKTGYGNKLLAKMIQLTYTDEYGDLVDSDALSELSKFVDRKYDDLRVYSNSHMESPFIKKARSINMEDSIVIFGYESQSQRGFKELCDAMVTACYCFQEDSKTDEIMSLETSDPYEYERLISKYLSELGWSSRSTSGSSDQGADVLAEKGGVKLVIQCKLYSQPVGNKAVQEVSAAKGYYDCNTAAVITNNTFTKSARKLAHSLSVYLLHHDQLDEFSRSLNL